MNMKTIIISVLLVVAVQVKAQNLKPMGAGLPAQVHCGCTDSLGNVYTVTHDYTKDTATVNKWDVSQKKWSVHSKLYSDINTSTYDCNFYKGKMYLLSMVNSRKVIVKEFDGNNWTNKFDISSTFPDSYISRPMSKIYDNKLYFIGVFDSVNYGYMPNVFSYDGATISQNNYNPSLQVEPFQYKSNAMVHNDTLYIKSKNKIIYHTKQGAWGEYFSFGNYVYSIAANKNGIYVSTSDSFYLVKNKKIIFKEKQERSGWVNNYNVKNSIFFELVSVKNKLFSTTSGMNNQYYSNLSEVDSNNVKRHFSVTSGGYYFRDSFGSNFIVSHNKLYIYGDYVNRFYNNHNIVEVNIDSLQYETIDTILIRTFVDKNKNLKLETSDDRFITSIMVDGNHFSTNSDGEYVFYGFDGYNHQISFTNNFSYDTCYSPTFTGVLTSKCYNSPITKDTLYMPLWKVSNNKRNIKVKLYTDRYLSRLDAKVNVFCEVTNNSCDYNAPKVVVKITLADGFEIKSSSHAYVSKVGNVLTYELENFSYYSKAKIKITGSYPFGKFNINDMPKHIVTIEPGIQEEKSDNKDSIVNKIVYSYDPNEKHSYPEGNITTNLKTIRYCINFQNEGNGDAIKVIVVDTLNLKMPIYAFQMVGASHPYEVSVQPGTNIVTWVFDNINLKPKSTDEEASKGFVVFDALVNAELRVGDSIRNNAHIYFDRNEPIVTNYAVIARVQEGASFLNEIIVLKTLEIYPNPTSGYFNIKNISNEAIGYSVMNTLGQVLYSDKVDANQEQVFDCSQLSKGVYFIVTSGGETVKLIVQ